MNKERLHLLLIFACVLFSFSACLVSLIALITIRDFHGIQKERMDSLEFKMLKDRVNNLEFLLPSPLKLSTEFSDDPPVIGSDGERVKTTIRKKLIQLGAYSEDGKIFDQSGKEIRFHQMFEFPGALPGGEERMKKLEDARIKNAKDLVDLERQYTVVKMWKVFFPR